MSIKNHTIAVQGAIIKAFFFLLTFFGARIINTHATL